MRFSELKHRRHPLPIVLHEYVDKSGRRAGSDDFFFFLMKLCQRKARVFRGFFPFLHLGIV